MLSDLCHRLEAAGLSVLVVALDGSPLQTGGDAAHQLLVLTAASDTDKARAAIVAAGLGHLLAPNAPQARPAPDELGRLQGELAGEPDAPVGPAGASTPAGPTWPGPSSSPHTLSEREIQVLRLFANGALHNQVARELYVSPKTVKNHLSHIYNKLGVANRTQAVALAVRNGLVKIA